MEVITWLLGGGKPAAMAIVASDHQNHVWRILPCHVPSVALPIPARGVDREASFATSAINPCEWEKGKPSVNRDTEIPPHSYGAP
jgi:hypothetical protein